MQIKKKFVALAAAAVIGIGGIASCAGAAVNVTKPETTTSTEWTQLGGSIYRFCDDEFGNLVYLSNDGIAVVEEGCNKRDELETPKGFGTS